MPARRKRVSRRPSVGHTDWISLLDVSGPFLLPEVVASAFPQGLDAHDAEHAAELRMAHQEWREAAGDERLHRTWIRWVLRRTLEFPDKVLLEGRDVPEATTVRVAEHHETLRPDLVVVDKPRTGKPGAARLLVQILDRDQDLDAPLAGATWKASPATRAMELLHGSGVPLGLVTNGERWTLVWAPKDETTGFASWYASLWFDEPITLRAFRSLLSVRRFFGVAADETIEALLRASASDQRAVTDQLGLQVRSAVERLVQTIDRIDKDRGRKLLRGVGEKRLYEAAVTVMMRLVFLFCAEERRLLPLDDAFYNENYAVSPLRDQLREAADRRGEEVLERRRSAWSRLLATFRAVHGGVRHEQMRLLAYGGGLFDPDRFPFLEGRAVESSWLEAPAEPLPIDDRTVLHLLEALQLLQARGAGGETAARRLSFAALDIEQIGHVYESLLDHTAVRASAPVLGLTGSKGKEPEIPLEALEERTRRHGELVGYVKEETGRSESAIERGLSWEVPDGDEDRWLVGCDNDEDLWKRVRPFAGLVRDDSTRHPVIIGKGSVYVTAGADRRNTGTHYTPQSLTAPMVAHTLEPLVYEGPAEGAPEEKWRLRSPAEILDLKVCDMAMGSGAFLVQACRYLSERLVEAWEKLERDNPGKVLVSPEGELSSGRSAERLLPKEPAERLALARRYVADRCLYGVDKDPMAVEMAKLSLWLVTLQKDRPFTFVDHALRCGDSLLGVTSLEQLEHFHLDPGSTRQIPLFATVVREAVQAAMRRRRELEAFPVNDVRDANEKARLLAEADAALSELRLMGDLVVGAALASGGRGNAYDGEVQRLAEQVAQAHRDGADEAIWKKLQKRAEKMLNEGRPESALERRALHWPLEFSEVFAAGGWSAMVGNPPFQGGKLIRGSVGQTYREFVAEFVGNGVAGHADLCAYFFLRAVSLLRPGGTLGMLATNTIAQGDTREVGLDQLVAKGYSIPRAIRSRKWPGEANLEVAQVWIRKGEWQGEYVLDETPVRAINSLLSEPGRVEGKPYRLAANAGKSFIGSYVLGMGFVLSPEEAQALIRKDRRNRDVLFPYLNGEDLNSRPDQSPSRWVINFFDWPLDRKTAPKGYDGPVAADYPDCLSIVREKVKPERQRKKPDGSFALRKPLPERWWHYADKRPALIATISNLGRVLVAAQTSRVWEPAFQPTGIVYSHSVVVFALSKSSEFACMQASFHEFWRLRYGPSLRQDARYTPSDCFETFPFPISFYSPSPASKPLEAIGDEYHEFRRNLTQRHGAGLTKTYGKMNDRAIQADEISKLRGLHRELDEAVAAAYGWSDLDLDHGFHETPQGVRFTISEAARREVLDRLLELNHQRYAEEVAQGLHEGKSSDTKKRKKSATPGDANLRLFD